MNTSDNKPEKKQWKYAQREKIPHDYLKHYRAIRKWVRIKYSLSEADIELLLFLHSERYFSKDKFDLFQKLTSWDRARFYRLKEEGWIMVWREKKLGTRIPLSSRKTHNRKTIYCLSNKGRELCFRIYNITNGNEVLSENPDHNPVFKKRIPFTQKTLRHYIIEMNKETRKVMKERNPNLEK